MKKILGSLLLILVVLINLPVRALELYDINDYLSGSPIYKWYDGNDNWSKTLESPLAITVSNNLVEGVDYIREYG